MATKTAEFDYEYDDELEDQEESDGAEDRGLSGLVVLLMGFIMIGAIVSIVGYAYQHGIKTGKELVGVPVVTADPGPLKIEDPSAAARFDDLASASAAPVETLAAGPEAPLSRTAEDPIAEIMASDAAPVEDAVGDRIARLAAQDAVQTGGATGAQAPGQTSGQNTAAQNASNPSAGAKTGEVAATQPAAAAPAARPAVQPTRASTAQPSVTFAGDPLSGSHLVQVGAYGSSTEASAAWASLQKKLGDYVEGKGPDVIGPLNAADKFHRLRIGPFASADAAKTYCEGLKTRGQDCLVKAK